jgi:DNA polymerase-4
MASQRKIIHIDMDCFYAAVEMRDFPQYRDVALAVGGNGPRSVLSTCNYQARKFGVRSAMSSIRAKQLCPELKIVNGRMDIYKEVSVHIREIFSRYTDLIEPLSLDEAYLDVTDAKVCQGSATLIAQQIRDDIYKELKLTASAGIAPNKFLAKIASDENKPNGQCVITPDKVDDFVETLSLKKIPGIGPKTFEKLNKYGFITCADIRDSNVRMLSNIVGKFSNSLYLKAHGIDTRPLEVARQRKSLAIETTLPEDLNSQCECAAVIDSLYKKLMSRLIPHNNREIVRQGIKLKFSDFNQTTVEVKTNQCQKALFVSLLEKAFDRANKRSIRLIGLTIGFADKPSNSQQLSLSL